jgi:hypothetical protein
MNLASQKRKENVAEYILLMWQITDLLRTLQFDEQKIEQVLVAPLNLPEDQAKVELSWYMDLCDVIKQEGKTAAGFISITEYLIGELADFHTRLLNEPNDEAYKMIVFNATPAIVAFKEKVATPQPTDVAYAFYALYSKLLMKLRNTEISRQTEDSFDEITRMVAYLSKIFGQFERGQFSFTED